MTGILDLSAELQFMIFDFLYVPGRPMHNLKNASLTCRKFHDLASRYLFQTVRMRLPAASSPSPEEIEEMQRLFIIKPADEDPSTSQNRKEKTTVPRYLESPDLSNCRQQVRNSIITLVLEPPGLVDIDLEFSTQFRTVLSAFLQSLPLLRKIRLGRNNFYTTEASEKLQRVQTGTEDFCQWLLEILKKMPRVKLEIVGWMFPQSPVGSCSSEIPALRSLFGTWKRWPRFSANLELLQTNNLHTLQTLVVQPECSERDCPHRRISGSSPWLKLMTDIFQTNKDLKCLDVDIYHNDRNDAHPLCSYARQYLEPLTHEVFETLLSIWPSTLESFTWRGSLMIDIQDLSSLATKLSNLRKLGIHRERQLVEFSKLPIGSFPSLREFDVHFLDAYGISKGISTSDDEYNMMVNFFGHLPLTHLRTYELPFIMVFEIIKRIGEQLLELRYDEHLTAKAFPRSLEVLGPRYFSILEAEVPPKTPSNRSSVRFDLEEYNGNATITELFIVKEECPNLASLTFGFSHITKNFEAWKDSRTSKNQWKRQIDRFLGRNPLSPKNCHPLDMILAFSALSKLVILSRPEDCSTQIMDLQYLLGSTYLNLREGKLGSPLESLVLDFGWNTLDAHFIGSERILVRLSESETEYENVGRQEATIHTSDPNLHGSMSRGG